MIEQLEKKLSK